MGDYKAGLLAADVAVYSQQVLNPVVGFSGLRIHPCVLSWLQVGGFRPAVVLALGGLQVVLSLPVFLPALAHLPATFHPHGLGCPRIFVIIVLPSDNLMLACYIVWLLQLGGLVHPDVTTWRFLCFPFPRLQHSMSIIVYFIYSPIIK